MFNQIVNKLSSEFKEDFLTQTFSWTFGNSVITDWSDLESSWMREHSLNQGRGIHFTYRLNGFRKGGANDYNESLQLAFLQDEYWYGFTLMGYKNNQPFLKKMYQEMITTNDIQLIEDALIIKVVERIEAIIEFMNRT